MRRREAAIATSVVWLLIAVAAYQTGQWSGLGVWSKHYAQLTKTYDDLRTRYDVLEQTSRVNQAMCR